MVDAVRSHALAFVLLGDVHSGAGLAARALAATPHVRSIASFGETPQQRFAEHRAIFADTPYEKCPHWWTDPVANIEEYLREYALEVAPRGELAIGVRLTYGVVEQHQLWEYLEYRMKEGSFCVIRFDRPPLDCFTSFRMSERKRNRVFLEPSLAHQFIRRHSVSRNRAARLFGDDMATVDYRDLLKTPVKTMQEIAEYLELPPGSTPPRFPIQMPASVFTPNNLRRHLVNAGTILAEAPRDVREIVDAVC